MSCLELAAWPAVEEYWRVLYIIALTMIDCVGVHVCRYTHWTGHLMSNRSPSFCTFLSMGPFFLKKAWHVCLKTVSVVGLDMYYVCILSVILQIQYQMPSWKLKDDAVSVKHCWWFVLRNLQWSKFLLKVAYIPSSQLHVRDMWGQ